MGSGDTVMKSGHHRDALAQREGIIAVEMEGAGVWRHGPSIVIKGVCDYADNHKRKGWQGYAAATAAACAKTFLMEWTPERKPSSSANEPRTNQHFLVPRRRAKDFFGREDELNKIASCFGDESDQPRILVLHAMGGQGKSQIALEYCQRTRHTYGGVFWVNGSSTSTTTQSLVRIAQELNASAAAALPDDDARVAFALRTLERWEHRWLMVFDNCDDAATFSEVERFMPQVGRGNILFTSWHRDLEELGDIIEVPPMPPKPGVTLLLHRYHGINIEDYMSEGTAIVNRLGGLALAIDQASAYMQYTRLPLNQLSTFLPQYNARREKVLQHTTRNFWKYMKISHPNERQTAINAFTTWEMSFQQLLEAWEERDSVAHFLTLSAFLGPTLVNESLFPFHWALSEPPPTWMCVFTGPSPEGATEEGLPSGVKRDTVARDNAMSNLSQAHQRTSFGDPRESWNADHFWQLIYQASQISLLPSISPVTESAGASFLLHPLIHDWLQLRLAPRERQTYTREAVDVIASSIRISTTRDSDAPVKLALLLHMDAVLASDNEFFHDEHRLGRDISTCDDAHWFASFYRDQGRYDASFSLRRVEMETRERVLGKEHSDTLSSMGNLATVLRDQGQHAEAEQIYRVVVEAGERVLGREHPDTLTSMNNLATVLND
ncbi:hypothetical protein PMZ80_011238 [Knufia obscura]|uniref:NB-ARC domain-containing protein n=1 Tax=Knufia obscura TaxID=1635080 RepID=A0ABR0R8C2_9EURO|nr:hypothetical protein PMZ80_011238 [Knufia obscura]